MGFIDRIKKTQDQFDSHLKGVGHGKYGRILRMARKPDTDEYVKVLQITALGAVLIGGVGFVIYIFFTQIGPWLWTQLQGL
ncbi:MAG: protein translocase SEC61 complex subunit gamma [Candidatus Thermoplasmatota archaeon]|jgi:protein transport protein SEC61 subunit gamma-like protein|nr:protein translocase SEC61 complex subunit gamma [Candidatus Thermoplasmatota archaeon]MCL5984342.1 protein translocase SEC61 complex subunit gamma [Candidatus Thermoplasmatota archaeon]